MNKMGCLKFLVFGIVFIVFQSYAHETREGKITYLANEAILVQDLKHKLLFDPFFHQSFNTYQLVPSDIRDAIFAGSPPFNHINVILISHAHDDHFAVDDVVKYLLTFNETKLVAPHQAIAKLREHKNYQQIKSRLVSINLAYKQLPTVLTIGELTIEAVRIPHAGWPSRANVENIVYRVTTASGLTVMHMGDSDADDDHYLPLKPFWLARKTDMSFPPYWFVMSAEGRDIINEIINTEHSVGIHVPVNVPKALKRSTYDYFSRPLEFRDLSHQKH